MTIQTLAEISEIKLQQRIESFLEENEESLLEDNEESLLEEEKQQLIDSLLNGKIPELSGVTAIRGFMYQYYVAANYIIDMLFSESVWWDKVIFEYLDDIAVSGGEKIRFVQVKTKKERNVANYLTPRHIYKREDGKGSWLDKLFLFNTHVVEKTKQEMIQNKKLFTSFNSFEFELATNVQYNESMEIYEKDEDFCDDHDERDYQQVIKALEAKGKKSNFQGPEKGIVVDASYYNSTVTPTIWYLNRFRIKRYGDTHNLKASLIGKIVDKSSGNGDLYHKFKATIILDSLLQEIIKRTCQDDDSVSSNSFIFHKKDLERKFKGWCVNANNVAHLASEKDSVRAKFTKCFDRIEKNITSNNWGLELEKELTEALKNMRKYLDDQSLREEDPFVYQRFLQRLFNTSNSQSEFPFDDGHHGAYLENSLEVLLYLSVFYKQASGTTQEARLLFQELLSTGEIPDVVSLYNVCKKKDMELAMKIVRLSAKDCLVSKSFKHDYYCFIADPKLSGSSNPLLEMLDCLEEDSVHASISKPAIEGKKLQDMRITDHTENIKFLPIDPIYEFIEGLKVKRVSSFKTAKTIDTLRMFLRASYNEGRKKKS